MVRFKGNFLQIVEHYPYSIDVTYQHTYESKSDKWLTRIFGEKGSHRNFNDDALVTFMFNYYSDDLSSISKPDGGIDFLFFRKKYDRDHANLIWYKQ